MCLLKLSADPQYVTTTVIFREAGATHVNDVNDNPPVFDRATYEIQITEEDDRNLPKRVLKVLNVLVWFSFAVLKFCFVDL